MWMARESAASLIGIDPAAAGLNVGAYEETPGWEERVHVAFSATAGNNDTLIAEMGERAAAAAAEAMLTLQIKPYPRRILAVASRPG